MFITYSSVDEVIVCTTDTEDEALKLYFTATSRHMENYDRTEHHKNDPAIDISAKLTVK